MVEARDVSFELGLLVLGFLQCYIPPLYNLIIIDLLVHPLLQARLHHLGLVLPVYHVLLQIGFLQLAEVALLLEEEGVLLDEEFFVGVAALFKWLQHYLRSRWLRKPRRRISLIRRLIKEWHRRVLLVLGSEG